MNAPVLDPKFEPITGRYLNLTLLGKPHRLYVEEAGAGLPLVCLHTANSDTRQYRGLMNLKTAVAIMCSASNVEEIGVQAS